LARDDLNSVKKIWCFDAPTLNVEMNVIKLQSRRSPLNKYNWLEGLGGHHPVRQRLNSGGTISSNTDTAIRLPDKGRVKKVDHSPWLMVSA
jgi:hypothetical protein